MSKREITCLIVSDGTGATREFVVGQLDNGRKIVSITLRTMPIASAFLEPASYVVRMESTIEKRTSFGLVPPKHVLYLEFIDTEKEKEEKPLELRVAAAAGDSNGEAQE